MNTAPHSLTAKQAANAIASGRLTSVALTQSCLDRIAETDEAVRAWAFLEADHALGQASKCDLILRSGFPIGPLHGVPVGLSDIVDTADMPTQRGSPIFTDRQTEADARLVRLLRGAGAVIIGKTATTELASQHASQTRHPHNANCSSGGGSCGSAAAVAAMHVPLAIGMQTNGSTIRSASYCGVFGFSPTRETISSEGLFQTSISLDQVGCFGRTLDDVALLTNVVGDQDQSDLTSAARPRFNIVQSARSRKLSSPDFAWFDLSFNDRLDNDTRERLNNVLALLGERVTRLSALVRFSNLIAAYTCIQEYELCLQQVEVFDDHWDLLSDKLKLIVERGRKISADEYNDALAIKSSAEEFFASLFIEYDVIIAPAAAGKATKFGNDASDPIFCTLWSLAGLPCITLPILFSNSGLPIGVQLIGPATREGKLLRIARRLQTHLAVQRQV